MAEPKSFASLSSSLLARKGAAKPAMRPQGWGQGVNLEDLGWNDMGGPSPAPERPEHVPSPIGALTPSPRLQPVEAVRMAAPVAIPSPVIEQQQVIEESFAVPAEAVAAAPIAAEEPVVTAPAEPAAPIAPAAAPEPVRSTAEVVAIASRQRRAPGAKPKAAFTLRLDADRHLKLRLACAVSHRSAQQLVTEALDTFLATLPEVAAMAGHMPAPAAKRS
jgi:hypothetical protein